MNSAEKQAVLHCLKSMIDEEACEECPLYGTTGTDHCEKDCVRLAINTLEQEPCDDCIRRSDVGLTDFEIIMCNGDYREGLKILLEKIAAAPSVTPAPKIGHWIKCIDDNGNSYYLCSACRCGEDYNFDFCPNCGSKNSE